MPAFKLITELFDYFRRCAQKLNCNPNFDNKQNELAAMNEKGENRVPGCLCRNNTQCPCREAENEIERDGMCYCEIFVRKS